MERFDVDLVVPVSEETPWIAELKSSAAIPVFCGPLDQVLQLHSKLEFAQAAADHGLNVPSTCRSTDAKAARLRAAPFVLKPEFSCSGRNVTLHDTGAPMPERSENLLMQQRVHGEEVSCFSICQSGECPILVTYRAHTRHGSVAVCFERISQPAVEDWVKGFAQATSYTGILSFDFIIDDAGTAWAIECNPRATSGIHFVAPEALYAAMVSPNSVPQIKLKPYQLMQEFWSHWTHWFSVIADGDARRHTGRALRAARDAWIVGERASAFWNTTYRRYFVDRRGYRERIASTYLTGETGTLSDYDALFQTHADTIGWDWRLLAAQAYQESRFRPNARSWAGAQGLLQLMPATGREFGVTDPNDPADNVAAAVRFLAWLQTYWDGEIADPQERLKFVLASYNTGHGHVEDARRLAVKHGDDPDRWEDVAYWLLQKSKRAVYTDPVVKYGFARGLEPVTYVAHILERWTHYQQFVG